MESSNTTARSHILSRRARIALEFTALVVLVVALAVGVSPRLAHAQQTTIGPKQYYLALGDSLAQGYQPNLNFDDGYVQQWYSNDLKARGATLVDYGCPGETTTTMVYGGCPLSVDIHNWYLGPQLPAAVNFLNTHKGQVSPVSLDIGANDVILDLFNTVTCTVSPTFQSDLANADYNLTTYILPQIIAAMKDGSGHMTGDLIAMNYCDPFQNKCPNSVPYVQEANQHLAQDYAKFGVRMVDVFTAYGGATTPNPNYCNWTWECSLYNDVHATNAGYGVIANTFQQGMGY